MPSIITLTGAAAPKPRKRKSSKKASGGSCVVGECKDVRNSRTGRVIALCCVGKSKSRSGWLFKSKTKRG